MTTTFDYFLSKPRELGIGLGLFLSIVSGIFGYIFPFKKFKYIPATVGLSEFVFLIGFGQYARNNFWTKDMAIEYAGSFIVPWLIGQYIFFMIPIFWEEWKKRKK